MAKYTEYKITGLEGDCDVSIVHVAIDDVDVRADEMIASISDTSWIEKLGVVEKISFKAMARKTIEKLLNNINERKDGDSLTSDFGEYLVSDTALSALVDNFRHNRVPLADLIKEKISGNPGFDFHSECPDCLISFGEAKYSGTQTRYSDALEQIVFFIGENKDEIELNTLKNFVSSKALSNFIDGKKSFVAAFSIHAKNLKTIYTNILKSEYLAKLLCYKKIYIIGVEIRDK